MAVYKRGKTFWFSFIFNGERVQRSAKVKSRKEAANIEKAAWTQLARGEVGIVDAPKPDRKTIGQLLDALADDYKMRGKDSEPKLYTVRSARAAFGSKMADTLTCEDVDRYINKRLAAGARPATVNRVTEVVGRAYRIAKLAPPAIRHLSEKDNVREGFFTVQEFESVVSHLPADLQDFIRFAFITGWRKSEIASLLWK